MDKIGPNHYGGIDYKLQHQEDADELAKTLFYGDRIIMNSDVGVIHQCSECGRGWLRYSIIAFVPMRGPCCPSRERLLEMEENFRGC